MTYCPFDIAKADSNLVELIKNTNLQPLPVYFLHYDSFNNAKEQLQEILKQKSQIQYLNNALYITIESLDQHTQQFIQSLHQHFQLIFAQGGLNKINRFLLESTSIDVLVDPHSSKEKIKTDFIHHFNSGINHILATFAKQKQIIFMCSLNQFMQKKKNLAKDIGRINQNIKIARKYSIPIYCNYIVSKPTHIKTYRELSFIIHLLGGSKEQIEEFKTAITKKIEENSLQQDPHTITKGLYIKEY